MIAYSGPLTGPARLVTQQSKHSLAKKQALAQPPIRYGNGLPCMSYCAGFAGSLWNIVEGAYNCADATGTDGRPRPLSLSSDIQKDARRISTPHETMSTTIPLETSPSNEVVTDESPLNQLFEYPRADLILRSHDSCDFRVSKLYIINSSPELSKHIQNVLNSSHAPHDSDEVDEDSLPVIRLSSTGTGAILHSLLTFIFPVSPVLPSTIEETMELLSVAQKYQMSSVLIHIRDCIDRQGRFTSTDTIFQIYSLAQNYGLRQEALRAAELIILNFPMALEDLEYKLDIMSGAALYELWKFHVRVRTILTLDLAEFRESRARGTLIGLRCVTSSSSFIPRWLDNYIESIGGAPNLFGLVEFDIARVRHVRDEAQNDKCTCACITGQTIRMFWEALETVFHNGIKKVIIRV
jgi:hypothetical protein